MIPLPNNATLFRDRRLVDSLWPIAPRLPAGLTSGQLLLQIGDGLSRERHHAAGNHAVEKQASARVAHEVQRRERSAAAVGEDAAGAHPLAPARAAAEALRVVDRLVHVA